MLTIKSTLLLIYKIMIQYIINVIRGGINLFFYERIKIRTLLIVNILLSILVFIGIGIYEHSLFIKIDKNLVTLFTYCGLLLWFLWRARKSNNKPFDFVQGFKKGFKFKEIILVILFHFLITIGFIFLVILILSYINPNLINTVLYDDNMIAPQSLKSKIYYGVTAVILAPIVEELAFRGIILNRFRAKWGISRAVILSSILFGVLHMKLAIIGAVTLGICLALIYIKTENILLSITVHFLNNLFAVSFMFLPSGPSRSIEGFTLREARIMGWALGVPLCIASIVFLAKYFRKNWPRKGSSRKALLVIDMQQAFFSLKDRELYRADTLINNITTLVKEARDRKIPIIYLQHTSNSGGQLQRNTEGWQIHPTIMPMKDDRVIYKKSVDPFTNTVLKKELEFMNIGQLIVTGLQTEYSIDTACRYGAGLGYRVTLVSDAHSTFDSSLMKAEQIIEHHNKILSDCFVFLNSTEGIILNNFETFC